MKNLSIVLLFILISLKPFAQVQDTCVYVSQQNQLGGLDCSLASTAPYTADSYQWLYCDSSFSQITDQTSAYYSGSTSVNVALEITYLGCVDTSDCYHVCTVGIEELELKIKNKSLLKIVDYMGIETEDKPNTFLIYIYSDGTKRKVFRVE